MRRSDREITDERAIDRILDGAGYLHLGMHDGEFPYVVPLHYGYVREGGRLVFYMHSATEGHKLDCLRAHPAVCLQIDRGVALISSDTPCGYSAAYESVICRGTAAMVEDLQEKRYALSLLMRTQTGRSFEISEAMARPVQIIRVDVTDCTAKCHRNQA